MDPALTRVERDWVAATAAMYNLKKDAKVSFSNATSGDGRTIHFIGKNVFYFKGAFEGVELQKDYTLEELLGVYTPDIKDEDDGKN